MKILRKLICGFAATVLVTFALPSSAATDNKWFYAEFPPTLQDVNASKPGVQIMVLIVNDSEPPGFSTINSIRIIPPPEVAIDAVVPGLMTPLAGGGVNITDFTGIRRGGSLSFELTVTSTIADCSSVMWTVFANTGNSQTGGTDFQPRTANMKLSSWAACTGGELKCPSLPENAPGIYNFSQSEDQNTTSGKRFENKDASACVPVEFNVMFSDTGRTVTVTWDEGSQPYAVLETTMQWPPELVDPLTNLPRRTRVDFGLGLIDAPTCLASNAPASYGTLQLGLDASETTVNIVAASLPAVPFPVVVPSVGGDPERMLVTGWTGPSGGVVTAQVIRGSGQTTAYPHLAGAAVVSTPLPVLTSGDLSGKQSMACIIEETFLTPPLGNAVCVDENGDTPLVEPLGCTGVKTRMYLISDPVITRSY